MTPGTDGRLDILALNVPMPPHIDSVALLGGKGAGLIEMTQGLTLLVNSKLEIEERRSFFCKILQNTT